MITKEFTVHGTITVSVTTKVKVEIDETDEEFIDGNGDLDIDAVKNVAMEEAYDKFGGVHEFVGNGGLDKLIGVYGTHESIAADGEVEFNSADEI